MNSTVASLSDDDVLAIRKRVHDINNALNVISMQSELVKLLAADSAAFEKISASVDTVLQECSKAGTLASEISSAIKSGK